MAPKSSSAEEDYISSFLQRSIVTQMINEGNKESNDADKDEGMAASVSVEEGSNSHTFVSYEEYCRAKRKRNEQFLAETLQVAKQLRQDTIQIASNRKKKKKKIVASSTSLTTDKSTPRRLTRSLNKRMHLRSGKEVHDQAAPTVLDTVQMDDESKEDVNGTTQLYRRRRPGNHFLSHGKSDTSSILQGKNINTHMLDVDWISEMYTFLLKVPHGQGHSKKTVSQTNAERVMCKVRQLMSGDGISYHHWPDGTIFGRNLQIDIRSTNFTHLLDEAIEFEETYGKDLGNGWLLRHPIEKLRLFQEYLLEKN
jgi:hypothetical protein